MHSWDLDVGGNQISSVSDLSQNSGIKNMLWAGACRLLIEQMSTDWHSESFSLNSLGENRFI